MSQRDPSGLPDLIGEAVEAFVEWLLEYNEGWGMPNWGIIVFFGVAAGLLWGVNEIHLSGVK